MPLIDATTYAPRRNESAMMSMESREAAANAYYAEMEAEGKGTVADFDGVKWFIPSNFDDLGADLAGVITARQPNRDLLAALLSAAFVRLGERVKADVLATVPAPAERPLAAAAPPLTDVAGEIRPRLERDGFTYVEGEKASRSQFSPPYVSLYNGATVPDGQEAPRGAETVEEAVAQTVTGIKMLAGAHRTLVWRLYPILEERNDRYLIKCRLHAMDARS